MMMIIIIHILSIYYPCSDSYDAFFLANISFFPFQKRPDISHHLQGLASCRRIGFFLGEATRKGLKTSWLPSGNGKSTINDDLMVGFLWLMMISWDLMDFMGLKSTINGEIPWIFMGFHGIY